MIFNLLVDVTSNLLNWIAGFFPLANSNAVYLAFNLQDAINNIRTWTWWLNYFFPVDTAFYLFLATILVTISTVLVRTIRIVINR